MKKAVLIFCLTMILGVPSLAFASSAESNDNIKNTVTTASSQTKTVDKYSIAGNGDIDLMIYPDKYSIAGMKDSDLVELQSGCCSWHRGVCGCDRGRTVCCDGSYSPSCRC